MRGIMQEPPHVIITSVLTLVDGTEIHHGFVHSRFDEWVCINGKPFNMGFVYSRPYSFTKETP